jgi:hypothetical protein
METMINARGFAQAPPAPQMFGNAGVEHMVSSSCIWVRYHSTYIITGEIWDNTKSVRKNCLQKPQALSQQSILTVQG